MSKGFNNLLRAAAAAAVDGLARWAPELLELITGLAETLLAVLAEALDGAFGSLTAPEWSL